MKFQFNPNLDFQHEAINAVAELFYVYISKCHIMLSKKTEHESKKDLTPSQGYLNGSCSDSTGDSGRWWLRNPTSLC